MTKLTMETETDNNINFLYISIRKERNRLSVSIRVYRKPTATNVIIPKDSCHPPEHKHAAIRYLLNRMNSYSLNEDNKKTEYNSIDNILTSNGYETSIIKQFNKPAHKENINNNEFMGQIYLLWKGNKIYYQTIQRNSDKNLIHCQQHYQKTFSSQTIQLAYPKSVWKKMAYITSHVQIVIRDVGQTGRSFHKSYQEHFHDFK